MTFLSTNEMTSAICLADSLDVVIPNKQASVEHFPGYRLFQLSEEWKAGYILLVYSIFGGLFL